MQYVTLSFLRRNEFLHLIGEEDHTYLIVVLDRREGECGGYFGRCVTFHLADRTKIPTAADIDEQHYR